MCHRPPAEKGRRDMVQGRAPRGNAWIRASTNPHTSSPQRTGIRTPGGQQNVPTDKSKVLVAEHAARRQKLCEGMRRMPTKQDQHATHQGAVITYIPQARSYAVRNCSPRSYY